MPIFSAERLPLGHRERSVPLRPLPRGCWWGFGPGGPRQRREVLGRGRCAATGVQEDALFAQFVYWQAASSKMMLTPNIWE